MFSVLTTLWRSRRLLKDFVVRDLKARYVGSSMGFFWSVVFPIINLIVYVFVFRVVLNTRWSDSQGATEVALVMLAGIVVWTAFAETVSRSSNSLVDHANLIKKVVFPSELLPAFLTISSLVNMCIGLPVVLIAVTYLTFVSPAEVHVLVRYQAVLDENNEQVKDETGNPVVEPVSRSVTEGGEPFAIKLQLSRGQSRDTVLPIIVGGSATPGEDYVALPKEVTVPEGHVSVTVLVHALADGIPDGPETLTLSIGDPEWAVPLRAQDPDEVSRHFQTDVTFNDSDAPPLDPGVERGKLPTVEFTPPGKHENYFPLDLGAPILLLPLLLFLQCIFTVGLGFFLSTLNVFIRDTVHLVGVGIVVWMFGTPIFYPAAMVKNAGFGWLLDINPMHWLIDSYRMILLHSQWPDPIFLGKFAGASVLMFFIGAKFFRSQRSKFPDLL
ncbi:MAG: ABC-type polysaccharide/polyol phosphate export permease [Planctomycetota bacterium]